MSVSKCLARNRIRVLPDKSTTKARMSVSNGLQKSNLRTIWSSTSTARMSVSDGILKIYILPDPGRVRTPLSNGLQKIHVLSDQAHHGKNVSLDGLQEIKSTNKLIQHSQSENVSLRSALIIQIYVLSGTAQARWECQPSMGSNK